MLLSYLSERGRGISFDEMVIDLCPEEQRDARTRMPNAAFKFKLDGDLTTLLNTGQIVSRHNDLTSDGGYVFWLANNAPAA